MRTAHQLSLAGLTPRRERGIVPTPPGAERLLAELVARGLARDRYVEAAALVLALDVEAVQRRP